MHQRGTKGLMWGARGSFPPAAAMVAMVAVGSWSLGHVSTVGIIYVFYSINLFFGINIYAGIKSIHPVRPGPIKFILFVNIPYRPESIDGIVKNKLPGKLFFFRS